MKRIAVINDLSGLGRCSLTAAIPVLSALGIQACPIPTAVLSAQTGFPGYHLTDLAADLPGFISHWKSLHLSFDGISTGFLSSTLQAEGVLQFLDEFATQDTLVLVDPVMGDDGQVYPGYDAALRRMVYRLVRRAQVITPNLTEACLLAGVDCRSVCSLPAESIFRAVQELALQLSELGPHTVAITGIHANDHIYNLIFDFTGFHLVGAPRLGGSFSGTGDLFSAVLHGCLLRGMSGTDAARLAVDFLTPALSDTLSSGSDHRQGVLFEPHLSRLLRAFDHETS